jgi:regulator of RNase E activity RraA
VNAGDFLDDDSNGVIATPSSMAMKVRRKAVAQQDEEAMQRMLAKSGLMDTMKAPGRA